MPVSINDSRKIYTRSSGQCNICKENLIKDEFSIGQMAHIVAQSESGPRGDETPVNGIDSYDNLILLCANDHSRVDKSPLEYTSNKLREIKKRHEDFISSRLDCTKERENDIHFLNMFMKYIPFMELKKYTESLPNSIDMNFVYASDMVEACIKYNEHIYPMNDQRLQKNI